MLLLVLALRQDLDEEGMLIAEEPLNFPGVDLDRHDQIVTPLRPGAWGDVAPCSLLARLGLATGPKRR